MEIKKNSIEIEEKFRNASEISENEFTEIITKLYFIFQRMPKNAQARYFKDLKISEYEDYFNL